MFKDERMWHVVAAMCLVAGCVLMPTAAHAQKMQSGLQLPKTVEQAYEVSKTAATDADFTKVITLCRRGLELKLDTRQAAYTRKLLAWAYNQRGEVRADAGADAKALADFEQSLATLPGWRDAQSGRQLRRVGKIARSAGRLRRRDSNEAGLRAGLVQPGRVAFAAGRLSRRDRRLPSGAALAAQ